MKKISLLLLTTLLFLIGCEKNQILQYEACGGIQLKLVNDQSQREEWPDEFNANVIMMYYIWEGEEEEPILLEIEEDLLIQKFEDSLSVYYQAVENFEISELTHSVYATIEVTADINGGEWAGNMEEVLFMPEQTAVIEIELIPDESVLIADFNAYTLEGDAPLAVQFYDSSNGYPIGWQWDFDDDGIIDNTSQNPEYTYDTPGIYTVSLTVIDSTDEDTVTKFDHITVNEIALERIAYYPFNGNADDESGHENNGTVYGAILTTDRFGNPNSAYDFYEFNNSFIDCGNDASLDLTEAITISAWIYTDSDFLGGSVVAKYDNNYYSINIDNYGQDFTASVGISAPMFHSFDFTWEWHHIAITYSDADNSMIQYIDGVNVNETSRSGIMPVTLGNLQIGGISGVSYFTGRIDDLGIYNYALSETEIQDLYLEGGSAAGIYSESHTTTMIPYSEIINSVDWGADPAVPDEQSTAVTPIDGTYVLSVEFLDNGQGWSGITFNFGSADISSYTTLKFSVDTSDMPALAHLEVSLENNSGSNSVVELFNYTPVVSDNWAEYELPLSDFASVNLTNIQYLGLYYPRDAGNVQLFGYLYFDDIHLLD